MLEIHYLPFIVNYYEICPCVLDEIGTLQEKVINFRPVRYLYVNFLMKCIFYHMLKTINMRHWMKIAIIKYKIIYFLIEKKIL